MKTILLISLLSLFVSCGKSNSTSSSGAIRIISSSFFDTFSIKKNSSQQGWDSSVSASLYESMKDPALVSLFDTIISEDDLKVLKCSNFNSLTIDEKSLFYIVFMSSITKLESGFDTNNMTYDPTHRNWNVGLLQIDRHSALRHAPEITASSVSDDDLKNEEFNLHIGLYILKNQINGKYRPEIRGKLLPSSSYYWEVLNASYRAKFLKAYFNNYDLLSFCQE